MGEGKIPLDAGAVAAGVESTYGTPPTLDTMIRLAEAPTVTPNADFVERDEFGFTRNSPTGKRRRRSLSVTMPAYITFMEDIIGGLPANHPAYIASGMAIKDQGSSAGSGNFIAYGPQDAGWGSAAFQAVCEESSADKHLSLWDMFGCRGTSEIVLSPDADMIQNLTARSKYAFPDAFAAGTKPSKPDLDIFEAACFTTATLDGNAIEIIDATWTQNNEEVDDARTIRDCEDGITEVEIRDGKPTLTMRVFQRPALIASSGFNYIRQAEEGIVYHALVLRTEQDTQFWQFSAPRLRILNKSEGEFNDSKTWDLECELLNTAAGNDSYEIRHGVI